MPRKLRELKADLPRAGFLLVRQTGSHQTWEHPNVPEAGVTLAGKDGDDAQRYQEKDVQAEVAKVKTAEERAR